MLKSAGTPEGKGSFDWGIFWSCLGVAVSIVLYYIWSRSRLSVIVSLALLFGALIYPAIQIPKVVVRLLGFKAKRVALYRGLCVSAIATGVILFGFSIWPVSSFFFVKPGVFFLDKGWAFAVVQRGPETLYHATIHLADQDAAAAVRSDPSRASELIPKTDGKFSYDELDPSHVGETSAEDGLFYWAPFNLEHEHFDFLLEHRSGVLRERLRVEKVGGNWQYAMKLTDEGKRVILIECRDAKFPEDGEFLRNLPACFPGFPNEK